MQFTEVPERLLSSQTAVRTLRVLLELPGREMTGRQIAALAHAPPLRVIERLRQFEREGLVTWRAVGPAHVWRLESGHVLVPALAALFEIDSQAKNALRRSLRKWVERLPGIVEARLFGSLARGDERPESDIDLLLVVKDRACKAAVQAAVASLRDELRSRFGNPLQVIVLTTGELRRRPRRAFLGPARREGENLTPAKSPPAASTGSS